MDHVIAYVFPKHKSYLWLWYLFYEQIDISTTIKRNHNKTTVFLQTSSSVQTTDIMFAKFAPNMFYFDSKYMKGKLFGKLRTSTPT